MSVPLSWNFRATVLDPGSLRHLAVPVNTRRADQISRSISGDRTPARHQAQPTAQNAAHTSVVGHPGARAPIQLRAAHAIAWRRRAGLSQADRPVHRPGGVAHGASPEFACVLDQLTPRMLSL